MADNTKLSIVDNIKPSKIADTLKLSNTEDIVQPSTSPDATQHSQIADTEQSPNIVDIMQPCISSLNGEECVQDHSTFELNLKTDQVQCKSNFSNHSTKCPTISTLLQTSVPIHAFSSQQSDTITNGTITSNTEIPQFCLPQIKNNGNMDCDVDVQKDEQASNDDSCTTITKQIQVYSKELLLTHIRRKNCKKFSIQLYDICKHSKDKPTIRQQRAERSKHKTQIDSKCKMLVRTHYDYKEITENVYVDVKPAPCDVYPPCNCQYPAAVQLQKACNDECLNRMMYAECSPETCPCANSCGNQSIQRHKWVKGLEKYNTENRGYGVRTTVKINADQFILEYVGEVVSGKEFRRRMIEKYSQDNHHYCLNLGSGIVIDGYRRGNIGRFVNHSCDPNCEMQKCKSADVKVRTVGV
ncbi:unnamed protein product [Owenia fusiformis]|uniref:Uncharacterized protein n=1 Tax=Owenia fusiformis TaxID=6347 RepID=A0A8S4N1L4_OWEFU|nr:unnamed protein product [Owenia fusiformis]